MLFYRWSSWDNARRKPTSWKSNSTVEPSNKKSSGPENISKNQSPFRTYSALMRWSTLSVLPRERDTKVNRKPKKTEFGVFFKINSRWKSMTRFQKMLNQKFCIFSKWWKHECALTDFADDKTMLPSYWITYQYKNIFSTFKNEKTNKWINYSIRCDVALAHEETSSQDAQGSEKSRLYRSVASQSSFLHGCSGRSERLSPQNRDEQEDLQNWTGNPHQGRKGNFFLPKSIAAVFKSLLLNWTFE